MAKNKIFKPDKEILNLLQSHDEATNLEAIEKLRSSGEAGYLPYLIRLSRLTQHQTVHAEIFRLLNDLKDKEAVIFLAEAIIDGENKPILKKLVESCWQNGLNFSQHLPVFINLIIHDNDEISFEAFTVIENMEYMPGDSIINKEIEKLEKHLEAASETRKYFIRETIKIISSVMD